MTMRMKEKSISLIRRSGLIFLFAAGLATTLRADESAIDDARKAIEEERFADAKSLLEDHIEASPEEAEAHYLLGRAERELGHLEASEDHLERAISLNDEISAYYSALGLTLITKGQTMNMFTAGPVYMSAMDKYRRAVELDRDNIEAHIGLTRYYWNAPAIGGGSVKKAKEHAAEVERVAPAQGKIEFALIAQKEGRNDEAIALFEEAVALNPNHAGAFFDLGNLYQTTGDAAKAKEAYKQALTLDPGHQGATAALAALE